MSDGNYERMSLQQAITTIKEEHQVSNYKLAKVLEIKSQIVIKRYLKGEIKSANTRVAYKIWSVYGILVDSFNSVEELEACYEAL